MLMLTRRFPNRHCPAHIAAQLREIGKSKISGTDQAAVVEARQVCGVVGSQVLWRL